MIVLFSSQVGQLVRFAPLTGIRTAGAGIDAQLDFSCPRWHGALQRGQKEGAIG
jgi:hypothetical protein